MCMAWVPGSRRHMCLAPRRILRIIVVSGGCPVCNASGVGENRGVRDVVVPADANNAAEASIRVS